MEPSDYLHVLRARWRTLVVFAAMGVLIGYGSSAFAGDEEPDLTTYWVAQHVVAVDVDTVTRFPNLTQLGLRITGEDIASLAAEEVGGDPTALAQRIRTVVLVDVNAIEISATSTDPDDARLLADTFADALNRYLMAEELADFEADLAQAEDRVEVVDAEIRNLEAQIDDLESQLLAAGVDPITGRPTDPEQNSVADPALTRSLAELADLELTLQGRRVALEEALGAVNAVTDAGEPQPQFETLDRIAPYTISAAAYQRRLAEGRRGDNAFTGEDPGDGGGGSSFGDRLDHPVARAGLGGLAMTMVAVGLILMHLRLDPRLRHRRDIENAFGYAIIAEIPKFPRRQRRDTEIHAVARSRSVVTEAYRMVRSTLVFAGAADAAAAVDAGGGPDTESAPAGDREPRVVMVTSPGPSEGKTTTVANLAVVLAEAGYEVLVVNCDYRLPTLHTYFGAPHEPCTAIDTGIPGVTLVAEVNDSLITNPTAIVESQRRLIERARARYDVVLLDTAPMLATSDAVALLPVVDLVVLVCREAHTSREAAIEAGELLRRRHARVAGIVVTHADRSSRSRYYHKYRYGSYYSKADQVGERPGGSSRRRGRFRLRRRRPEDVSRRPAPRARSPRRSVPETAPYEVDPATTVEREHQN